AARPGDTVRLQAVSDGAVTRRDLPLPASGAGVTSAQAPSVLPPSVWRSSLAPLVLTAAVGLLVLLAIAFYAAARSGNRLAARIAPHLAQPQSSDRVKRRRQGQSLRKHVVAATENAFANVKQFHAVQRLLTRADSPLLASELLYACLGAGALCAVLGAV